MNFFIELNKQILISLQLDGFGIEELVGRGVNEIALNGAIYT